MHGSRTLCYAYDSHTIDNARPTTIDNAEADAGYGSEDRAKSVCGAALIAPQHSKWANVPGEMAKQSSWSGYHAK